MAESTSNVVVLCDFDGTATPYGVVDEILGHFADAAWLELAKAWERQEIGTAQGLPLGFSHVRASRAQMEAMLDTIPLDPAFPELMSFCQSQGYTFAVVSDGLVWYIRYILACHGIQNVAIYANEIRFNEDGFHLSFPWYSPETPLRGTSKVAIIRHYQNGNSKVVFIGDGQTDIEAAPVADLVYARADLLSYCQAQGIPAIAFSTLRDVLVNWREP